MSHAELAGIKVGDGNPVVIVGAINVGAESFYSGSVVQSKAEAVKRASAMLEEGAHVIDVGAMSTAPGAEPISTSLEMRRLIPVVRALAKALSSPISVDTQRAIVAEAAIEAGASIVNDVSGLKADPKMARVLSSFGCSTVLMAAKERPGDAKSIDEIMSTLRDSLRICELNGIDERKVVLDPGIGFGKGAEWDLHILANLSKLKTLGRPICVAVSRKSFIGRVLNLPDPADRLWGSLAATAIAVLNGADVVRTHDPKETSHAVRIAEAIRSVDAKVKRFGGERGSAR